MTVVARTVGAFFGLVLLAVSTFARAGGVGERERRCLRLGERERDRVRDCDRERLSVSR